LIEKLALICLLLLSVKAFIFQIVKESMGLKILKNKYIITLIAVAVSL